MRSCWGSAASAALLSINFHVRVFTFLALIRIRQRMIAAVLMGKHESFAKPISNIPTSLPACLVKSPANWRSVERRVETAISCVGDNACAEFTATEGSERDDGR